MKSKDKDKAKLAAGAVSAGYVLGSENRHPIGYMNKVYQKSRQPFRKVEEEDFKVVKKLREVARKQKTHVFDQKGDDFYHDSQMGQNNLDRAKKFIKEQKDRYKDLRYWKDSTGINNLKGTGLEGERRSIKDAIKNAKSVLNSKDYIQIDSSKKMSKGFSETKENASKGLAYGSTAAGLGALGATAATLGYDAKAVRRGLKNSAAFEGKTLGELLKSKKFKDATTRVKKAINNREAKASNMAGKASKIAGGLAAASIAMGAGSKLLKGKSDKKK